jgi:hypothetical protein
VVCTGAGETIRVDAEEGGRKERRDQKKERQQVPYGLQGEEAPLALLFFSRERDTYSRDGLSHLALASAASQASISRHLQKRCSHRPQQKKRINSLLVCCCCFLILILNFRERLENIHEITTTTGIDLGQK